MNILGISGSPVKRGTYYLLQEALDAAASQGIRTEMIHLADYKLKQCLGCNHCLQHKECILDDGLAELVAELKSAEGMIIGSPSYFGSVTGLLKNFIDRSRCLKMDDYALHDKVLGAVVTSGLKQGGGQSTSEMINRFGLIQGMIVVGPVGQPKKEPNLVVGTAEKDTGWRSIKEDKKAITVARSLGQRVAAVTLAQKLGAALTDRLLDK